MAKSKDPDQTATSKKIIVFMFHKIFGIALLFFPCELLINICKTNLIELKCLFLDSHGMILIVHISL